jgi:hypothetical protein
LSGATTGSQIYQWAINSFGNFLKVVKADLTILVS